jgi:hypothetical protein
MPAAMKTKRTLRVVCPFCHDPEGTVMLDLDNLNRCECSSCSEEFAPQEAYEKAAEIAMAWSRVVAWIDKAPVD